MALTMMRDRWPTRLTTALLWPLGPAAFVLVVAILVAAAAVLWPVPVLAGAALAALAAWWMT